MLWFSLSKFSLSFLHITKIHKKPRKFLIYETCSLIFNYTIITALYKHNKTRSRSDTCMDTCKLSEKRSVGVRRNILHNFALNNTFHSSLLSHVAPDKLNICRPSHKSRPYEERNIKWTIGCYKKFIAHADPFISDSEDRRQKGREVERWRWCWQVRE